MNKLLTTFKLRLIVALVAIVFYTTDSNSQDKPNFIIILADDMGYSDLGCMGSEIRTPNLDSLANNGVLFTNFYNASRSYPSRASLLTGLYPHQAGVGHKDLPISIYPSYQGHLSENAVTLAEVLGSNGYSTFICGKWDLGSENKYWPTTRGFQKEYSTPVEGDFYFYPSDNIERPVYYNGRKQVITDSSWYSTDAFTDYSIKFIKEAVDGNKPFFLYLPYIAPHYPVQAFEEDIKKYEGIYSKGYEAVRNARFEKQKKIGIVERTTVLSPGDYADWNSYTDTKKEDRARRMQVYAAMVDRLDVNIGRLKDTLEKLNIGSNTVIMFLSDNGSTNVWKDNKGDGIGTPNSYVSCGKSWANVSNTPFRKYERHAQEGGIISPLITYWPKGISGKGSIVKEPAHITDVMATCLDIADIDYPKTFKGKNIVPLEGKTFQPLLNGAKAANDRVLYWEHEGNRAVRSGDWKLVQALYKDWELYNLKNDPTELNDLIGTYPDLADSLYDKYVDWTLANGVLDWKARNPMKTSFHELERSDSNITGDIYRVRNIIKMETKAVGEYVEFLVPVYVKGYYTISLEHKTYKSRGTYKVIINDTLEIDKEFDLYRPNEGITEAAILAEDVLLNNGMAKFRFEITGKNPESDSYHIVLRTIGMEYTGTSTSNKLKPVDEFPYPAFNGYVLENLVDYNYSAPSYKEKLLKVKNEQKKSRHAYLIFDVSEISDSTEDASLLLFYRGTHDNSLLESDTTFYLYFRPFYIDSQKEPTWSTLQPADSYEPVDTFYVTDRDIDEYVEAASKRLAEKLKEVKAKGARYACFVVTRSADVNSPTNVQFDNTSTYNKPYVVLKYGNGGGNLSVPLVNKPEEEFVIVPNPSSGFINIRRLEAGINYNMRLINSQGEVVYSSKVNNTTGDLNIGALPNGIYVVQVENNRVNKYQYLIIRK